MRMPTNNEILVGIGLAMGFDLMVLVPLLGGKTSNENFAFLIFVSAALGILVAMKLRDRQHANLARSPLAKVETYCESRDLVKVSCPCEVSCTGELRLMPPREESILYLCPKCDTMISVGRKSTGEVIAYAAGEAKVIR